MSIVADAPETDDLDALYEQWLAEIEWSHAYNLELHHHFKFVCELADVEFTSTVLSRTEARELLEQLEIAAIEELDAEVTQAPSLVRVLAKQSGKWVPLTPGDLQSHRIGERCLDCQRETINELHEYYMVQFELWERLVPEQNHRGMLCVGCLEQRLGRELTAVDFIDAPVNEVLWGHKSPRLLRRITDDGSWLDRLPEGIDAQAIQAEIQRQIALTAA